MSRTRAGRRMAEAAYARCLLRLRIVAQVTCAASRSYGRSDVGAPRTPPRRPSTTGIVTDVAVTSPARSRASPRYSRPFTLAILSLFPGTPLSSVITRDRDRSAFLRSKIVVFPAAATSRPVATGLSLPAIARSKL